MTTHTPPPLFLKKITATVSAAAMGLLIIGTSSSAQAAPINAALASNGGVATQSSNWSSGSVASLANDGNTNGLWSGGSVSHTWIEYQAWWQVALGGGATTISEIDVWNRMDCCINRINDFNVTIFNGGSVVWQSLHNSYTAAMPTAVFTVPSVVGDTVRVWLNGTDYLHLAEVQVWGTAAAMPEPGSIALVAAGLSGVAWTRRRQKRQA